MEKVFEYEGYKKRKKSAKSQRRTNLFFLCTCRNAILKLARVLINYIGAVDQDLLNAE